MKTLALTILLGGMLAAQEAEKKPDSLTDSETGVLGGFIAEKLDANPGAEEFANALAGRIEEIRKARGTTAEKKEEPAPAKGKARKKAGKRAAKKRGAAATPDVIKNGLVESDRLALGKFALREISENRKGQELADGLKKELERLRQERVKASSAAETQKPKRKKKK